MRTLRAFAVLLSAVLLAPGVAYAEEAPPKQPVAIGFGGAVASIDADATAAALGVTDPFSAGIGGGGFFVYYDARTRQVHTLDGRETAPASADENLSVENGQPIPFAEAVTSGMSAGVPGTPATWQDALRKRGPGR